MRKINYYLASAILLFFPFISKAAVLFLDPASGQYAPGDKFIVKIKIDNQGDCINALDAEVNFSGNLKMVDFSTGDSIISLWLSKPNTGDVETINTNKKFHFSGGIPGGYCGSIMGDLGETNILGEIIFTVPENNNLNEKSKTAEVSISPSPQVLLNDGNGTPASVTLKNAQFEINEQGEKKASEWDKRVQQDEIPPEAFTVELYKDPRIFDGKNYIIFSAADKQTGVDHYEVLEIKPGEEVGKDSDKNFIKKLIDGSQPQWKIAASPYLLEDQDLQSNIYVKAIDKAGNEKTVKVKYTVPEKKYYRISPTFMIGIFVVILLIAIIMTWWFLKRSGKSNIS